MAAADLERLPDGRWLLRRGGRRFLVPPGLGRRLAEGGTSPDLDAALADRRVPPPSRRRGLRPRRTLLPARAVDALAGTLAPLAAGRALVAAAAAGAAALAWALPRAPAGDAAWAPALAAMLLSAVLHELGHAAALRRGGGRPGPLGVGLALVVPALWCDVSEVVLLGRGDRVRVDLAGPAWQLAAAGALAAGGVAAGSPAPVLAARCALLAVVWSLLPLPRTDGAWVVSDLLGLADLTSPAPPDAAPARRRLAASARLAAAALLAGLALAGPWRLAPRLRYLWSGPAPVDALATSLFTGLLALVLTATFRRVRALIRIATADLRATHVGGTEEPRPCS